ncbi:hypothetical protein [Rhizobium sp. 18055]|uniref:hypothetical protein n=1 Tax=Rhizobium sp. 18055 TaxID=2681403 RepID=UPI00135CE6EC|nr:hypothetical protein [Rhizobium sp. 18055]
MDSLPIIIFWIAAVLCVIRGPVAIIYLLFLSMPFGAFAVVPPAISAGMTFTPAPMAGLLLIARVFLSLKGLDYLVSLVVRPQRLTLLLAFWLVALFTTVFMPRLLARKVEVIPLKLDLVTAVVYLEPTSQNISQLCYMTISVLTVCAFAYVLRSPAARAHTLRALYIGATVLVVTGGLDFANQYVPLGAFLEPFRTATYSLLTDAEILGAKRIVGLMPEASAFGSVTVGFLSAIYFFRSASADVGISATRFKVLIVFLLVFVWLSTSSAAYVGLFVFFAAAGLEWLWRGAAIARGSSLRRGMIGELLVLTTLVVVVCLVTVIDASIWTPLLTMLDETILQKNTTSSFEERGTWTSVSWQAFLDSNGLGVGLGGTRASNSVVSLLSNVGLLGGLLYYGFLAVTLLRPLPRGDANSAAYLHGARWSFVAPFATSVLAATTPDFGTFNAFLFAMALSSTVNDRHREMAKGSLVNG